MAGGGGLGMEDGGWKMVRAESPVLNGAILYARSSILVTTLSEIVDGSLQGQAEI